jgi:GT2 family glycosyltransferase
MNPAAIRSFTVIVPAYNASGTIAECLEAILNSTRKPGEVIVYHDGRTDKLTQFALAPCVRVIANPGAPVGPARGRNIGVRESTCDVVIFVDADVIVAKDAFRLLLEEMEKDDQVWAAFGSYDRAPRVTRRAALYANLRHHWVHQSGEHEAVTFWAGLGAMRRDAFCAAGGFDEGSGDPAVEDIALGAKLIHQGGRIRLVPDAQGTHCKDWTIAQLWRTDIFHRAIPWARLLASGACVGGHLNGAARERVSAVLAYLSLITLAGCFVSIWSGVAFVVFALSYISLNRGLFKLLLRRGGILTLIEGVTLHWIYHLYASAAYILVKLRLVPPPKNRPRIDVLNAPSVVPLETELVRSGAIGDEQNESRKPKGP